MTSRSPHAARSRLPALVELARVDQWVKNVAILPGAIVAALFRPELAASDAMRVALVFVAACLLSSSSYVLNGILDRESDRTHPVKLDRPLPAGRIAPAAAWLEWALLGLAGLVCAWAVGVSAGWTAVVFAAAALLYNVPPLRAKDVPYLDIVVEAFNNPLRLALGWFAVETTRFPPLSLLLHRPAASARQGPQLRLHQLCPRPRPTGCGSSQAGRRRRSCPRPS